MVFSADKLEGRTRRFAIQVILFARGLRPTPELWEPVRQLTRAAASVGANHRAMSRSRSADECCYWFELLEATLPDPTPLAPLHREARELRAIFAKAKATLRRQRPG